MQPRNEDYPENRDPQKYRSGNRPANNYPETQKSWDNNNTIPFHVATSGPDKNDNCLFALIGLVSLAGTGLIGTYTAYKHVSASPPTQQRIVDFQPQKIQGDKLIQQDPTKLRESATNYQIDLVVPKELLRTEDDFARQGSHSQ